MTYEEGINAILEMASDSQKKDPNGKFSILRTNSRQKFYKLFPNVGKQVFDSLISELDSRGWVLSIDAKTITFDPATFE